MTARRNWLHWLGTAITVLALGAALWEWRRLDLHTLIALLPVSIGFYLLYVVYYFTGPISEWYIYHRLWDLPVAGMVPLLRKKVSNELVLGYLGDLYFYVWARRHSRLAAAPFGAIKDVAILSALAGNVITLVMLAAGAPLITGLFTQTDVGMGERATALSVAFIAMTSLLILLARRHVLSLPPRELRMVLAVHGARIVLGSLILAVLWHMALPGVAMLWWILLSMLRQLVSRLPFVPNKDVVFAGLAIFLVGSDQELASLMALIAGLVLLSHVALALVLALVEFARTGSVEPDGSGTDRLVPAGGTADADR